MGFFTDFKFISSLLTFLKVANKYFKDTCRCVLNNNFRVCTVGVVVAVAVGAFVGVAVGLAVGEPLDLQFELSVVLAMELPLVLPFGLQS